MQQKKSGSEEDGKFVDCYDYVWGFNYRKLHNVSWWWALLGYPSIRRRYFFHEIWPHLSASIEALRKRLVFVGNKRQTHLGRKGGVGRIYRYRLTSQCSFRNPKSSFSLPRSMNLYRHDSPGFSSHPQLSSTPSRNILYPRWKITSFGHGSGRIFRLKPTVFYLN
jgi:hypothetical protein